MVIRVTFDVSELEQAFVRGVARLGRDVADAVEVALKEGQDVGRNSAKFKDRTGDARAKTEGVLETKTANGAAGVLRCEVPYASFLNDGTAAHPIYPRAGKGFTGPLQKGQKRGNKKARAVLSWTGEDGEQHFARMVNHPGTQPDGFMDRAREATEKTIEREVEKAGAHFSEELSR